MAPGATQQVVVQLALPVLPPVGYESLEYADLQVQVDPAEAVAESTESNNLISSPIIIQPLPTTAGLFMVVKDNTQTARNAGEIPLNTGTTHLTGPGIDRQIPISEYTTILANDLPIGASPITYHVSWQESGYRQPDEFLVSIGRNSSDPYQVDYSPGNTVLFETDTWGSLSGTITAAGSGSLLSGALVRLKGQGLDLQTSTDANGQFSAATEPKLGQLIPGAYAIYISAANYARLSGQLTIQALTAQSWSQPMSPTTKAYVRGSLINAYGWPVANAAVNACDSSIQTASDGSFDLGEVDASCTVLQISKSGYGVYSQPLALTAGLEGIFRSTGAFLRPPGGCGTG